MHNTLIAFFVIGFIYILFLGVMIYILSLVIKALKTYIDSNQVRADKKDLIRTLGENIKYFRTENKMTQEFIAEHLGVSRQSVSKWETGSSEPSTSNLITLAKLLDVDVKELIGQ